VSGTQSSEEPRIGAELVSFHIGAIDLDSRITPGDRSNDLFLALYIIRFLR
jgi:hypothetical protein